MSDFDLLAQLEVRNRGPTPGLVLLAAAVENLEDLKPTLRRYFTHTIEVEGPDEARRVKLLHHFLGFTPKQAFPESGAGDETIKIKV